MKIYWCGPTMGKTTAVVDYSFIIDFDQVAREPFEQLANELNMSVRQMKTEMPKEYHILFLALIHDLKSKSDNKSVLVSNAVGLLYPELFEELMIPAEKEFLTRNINRGMGFINSWSWYHDLNSKYKADKKCKIENRFISEFIQYFK